jgi:asparagine synthase (glutamine-hydrolysing)
MCGIFAAFSLDGRGLPDDAEGRVSRALQAIRHRGPDASGVHVDPARRFALGHVRLSVIDLDASSNQPMWSECGRYFVVFNGEIYNYLELRADLERDGVAFRTGSDTEVLLRAIAHWGPDCIRRFNGMWAFVWGDVRTGRAVVSRDRWGVKPLYTQVVGGTLLLCSEAKGLFAYAGETPEADQGTIGLFLRFGAGGEERRTWFRGVERFPVSTWQEFGLEPDRVRPGQSARFWKYPTDRARIDDESTREEFAARLTDSVRIRLRADVPLGLSLSGGLDSAAIAWIVSQPLGRRLQAFTAWYEPMASSELPRATEVAAKFGHEIIPVAESPDDRLVDDLRTAIWHLDSGHASPAIVPYLNLCRAARSRLTVMLEGQGADELLAGYVQFQLFAASDAMFSGRFGRVADCARAYALAGGWASIFHDALRFAIPSVYLRQGSIWGAHALLSDEALHSEPTELRRLRVGTGNLAESLRYWHEHNLTNLLQYGDAVSMSVNLETRCPFLDYRLVELGFSLIPDLLVGDGYGKLLLRRHASGAVPEGICWNRRKEGFTNPTARVVSRRMASHGLPRDGLDWAVGSGLLSEAARDRDRIARLPENIAYRMMSVALWGELFQCSPSGRGR